MFSSIKRAPTAVPLAIALAAGAMFGGSVVSVASPQATVIYTRTASCGGLNFYTAADDQPYGEIDTMRTANGQVRCNASLPNGAVVTKVSFTVRDESASEEVGCAMIKAYLVPTAIEGSTFPYTNMTDYMTTTQAGTPGLSKLTDTSIDQATIDNVKNAYYVQCGITQKAPTLGLYGATITYKISSTKG